MISNKELEIAANFSEITEVDFEKTETENNYRNPYVKTIDEAFPIRLFYGNDDSIKSEKMSKNVFIRKNCVLPGMIKK